MKELYYKLKIILEILKL